MSVTRKDNSAAVMAAIYDGVANGLSDAGQMVADNARSTVHVITGNLRDSISYDATDEEVVISAGMPYAAYEELGTSRQDAHPYLRPAAMDHTQDILNTIGSAVQKAIS